MKTDERQYSTRKTIIIPHLQMSSHKGPVCEKAKLKRENRGSGNLKINKKEGSTLDPAW